MLGLIFFFAAAAVFYLGVILLGRLYGEENSNHWQGWQNTGFYIWLAVWLLGCIVIYSKVPLGWR